VLLSPGFYQKVLTDAVTTVMPPPVWAPARRPG
jgi:hypothetical protein